MRPIDLLTKEEILKMDCNYCKYVFYKPEDKEELQRCRAMSIYHKPPINKMVLELIRTNIFHEYGCCVCEYFAPTKNKTIKT